MRKREINGKTSKKSVNRIPDSMYPLEKSEFSDSLHWPECSEIEIELNEIRLELPEIELELDEINLDWLECEIKLDLPEFSESSIIPEHWTE
jgi:hypothetical protein